MKIYKVVMTTTAFVRAENKEEAKELALDDDTIMTDKCVISATQSNRREMQKMMFFGGDDND